MKYLLKEPIPNTDYEVGYVFEGENNIKFLENFIYPHEILLMLKAGILEEVDESWPKEGDRYWIIDDEGAAKWSSWCGGEYGVEEFRKKTNNIYRTKEEAQAALDKILES